MQKHSKFKVFVCKAKQDRQIPESILAKAEKFVQETGVAAKSVGVEYLEREAKIVLSLGYHETEKGKPVELTCRPLGPLGVSPRAIEKALEREASEVGNVLCHEFYVDENKNYFLILMSGKK